jgi:hypothetical protein
MKGLRAIRVKTLKEETLIATVDIGLTTNTGYCTTLDGRDIKPFRFDNTKEGFVEVLVHDHGQHPILSITIPPLLETKSAFKIKIF